MIIALKYFFEKKGLHLAVPFLSHIIQKVNVNGNILNETEGDTDIIFNA